MWVNMYMYFSAAWLIGYNWERHQVRNTNTFWESGTRLWSLTVEKMGKQIVGDREMTEDCRSPKEAPHPVKEVREGFLEEAVFELHRSMEVGKLRAANWGRETKEGLKRQARPTTMACLLGYTFELSPETKFPKKPNLLLSKTIPQH